MDSYQITFDTWNKVASVYQDKFMDLDMYHDTYDRFCQLIEKRDSSVFEIGCGPGNVTKYLLSRRPDLSIEAIDVSPNMIALAQANNPSARFMVMDCREIGTFNAKFDAIISGFCMPYLSKEDCAKFIQDCSALLQTAGIFYFSTIKGDYRNSGYAIASTGDRTYTYYYDEDYLLQELKQNEFELLDLAYKNYPKSDGTTEVDMIFMARKV